MSARDFRQRAKVEADRYGADPWIFVRELVQNGRDAGATRMEFCVRAWERDGIPGVEIVCTDDGEGMDFDHAKRFLFSLYTSSKEGDSRQVGRFGVGFWSVLRFDPEEILVRSQARSTSGAWQVRLRGDLESAVYAETRMASGTQVLLRRTGLEVEDTFRRISDAARQNARFVRCRDVPDRPMKVVVNGEVLNRPFSMPAPSTSFRRRNLRGVVGLGSSPRVELFARGLRVRAAASLDDLLAGGKHSNRSRVRFSDLPGGLAPQALLESDALELLLSRSDARDDKTLRKLVGVAQKELGRLIERQLASVRPPTLGEWLIALLRRLWGPSVAWRAALSALAGALVALIGARILWPDEMRRGEPSKIEVSERPSARTDGYTDLGSRYNGPEVSALDPQMDDESIALSYVPIEARPYFTALVVEADAGTSPSPFGTAQAVGPAYVGMPCEQDCLEIALPVDAPAGPLRVPVPVGHRLDTETLTLDGEPIPVYASTHDEPVLILGVGQRGQLTYRTGPAASLSAAPQDVHPSLPDDLRATARALRKEPVEVRVHALLELTRAHVRYETSDAIGERHAAGRRAGQDFITRTLVIGAGDCDVQNGLLVQLLRAANLEARLAVGYTGRRGSVSPWLHAWAEYRQPGEPWAVADASATEAIAVAGPDRPPQPSDGALPSQPGSPPSTNTTPPGQDTEAASSADPSQGPPQWADRIPRQAIYVASALIGVGLLGLAFLLLSGRVRRQVELDDSGDLSELLQGALQKPAAFAHLPFLFSRRLIPLVGGRAISLERATELAGEGTLYRATGDAPLTRDAVRRGAKVLDEQTPEGRVVADSLGAANLDRWDELLAAPVSSPLLERANRYLASQGRRWELRAVDSLPEGVASLDLEALGIAKTYRRLIVIDRKNPWLCECEEASATRPQAALFGLIDHVCERAGVAHRERAEVLLRQASLALHESVDQGKAT